MSWHDGTPELATPENGGGVSGGALPPIVPSLKLPSSTASPGSANKPFIPKLALRDTTQDALRAPLTRSSRRQSFRLRGPGAEGESTGAAPVSMSFTMRFGTPAATVRELASTRATVASDTQARTPGVGRVRYPRQFMWTEAGLPTFPTFLQGIDAREKMCERNRGLGRGAASF
jgi:hypothetical protein